jgi:hypothetical protein
MALRSKQNKEKIMGAGLKRPPRKKNPWLAPGTVGGATFVIGAEGAVTANTRNVAIQLQDSNGVDLAVRGIVQAYLSNDANGDTLATNNPTGGVVIGTDGVLIPGGTNGLLVSGALAISVTAEKFKTTATIYYILGTGVFSKAATDNLVFSAAYTVNNAGVGQKWGAFLVQINAAGTFSTKAVSADQVYATEAAAIAALPSADAGNIAVGYITVENKNNLKWTANTDDLTDGSDNTDVNFYNSSLAGQAKAFTLVSEADGDIDVNILDTGTPTFYLILVMPDGSRVASGAITFA